MSESVIARSLLDECQYRYSSLLPRNESNDESHIHIEDSLDASMQTADSDYFDSSVVEIDQITSLNTRRMIGLADSVRREIDNPTAESFHPDQVESSVISRDQISSSSSDFSVTQHCRPLQPRQSLNQNHDVDVAISWPSRQNATKSVDLNEDGSSDSTESIPKFIHIRQFRRVRFAQLVEE